MTSPGQPDGGKSKPNCNNIDVCPVFDWRSRSENCNIAGTKQDSDGGEETMKTVRGKKIRISRTSPKLKIAGE